MVFLKLFIIIILSSKVHIAKIEIRQLTHEVVAYKR